MDIVRVWYEPLGTVRQWKASPLGLSGASRGQERACVGDGVDEGSRILL